MRTALKAGLVALALVGISLAELYPKTGVLQLKIEGVTTKEGKIVVSIYDSKERWMKTDKALLTQSFDPQVGSVLLTVRIPLGRRYAVSCYQDLNSNGKLDTGFPIPKPIEPVGTSIYKGGSIPRFYDCSFRFNAEPLVITIPLRDV